MRKTLCMLLILFVGLVSQVMAEKTIGVFANNNTNSIQLIDPMTMDLSPSYLKGYLGSYGGGLFDVIITPNGKKAVVSNFGDSTIYVLDISHGFGTAPTIIAWNYIGFFAEDMVVTPDGNYALVTDGGFSAVTALVNLNTLAVKNFRLPQGYANSVDLTPDGKTVIFCDYFGMAVHSYALDTTAQTLVYKDTAYLDGNRPVNSSISPDGKTIAIACAGNYKLPILTFWGDKKLHISRVIQQPTRNAQSITWTKDSKKFYVLSNSQNKGTNVLVYESASAGAASYKATIPLSIARGTSQLFGVDTIALDPSNNYLYVTNPTVSGGVKQITVIDLTTNTEVNQISANGIPTGIAFGTIAE